MKRAALSIFALMTIGFSSHTHAQRGGGTGTHGFKGNALQAIKMRLVAVPESQRAEGIVAIAIVAAACIDADVDEKKLETGCERGTRITSWTPISTSVGDLATSRLDSLGIDSSERMQRMAANLTALAFEKSGPNSSRLETTAGGLTPVALAQEVIKLTAEAMEMVTYDCLPSRVTDKPLGAGFIFTSSATRSYLVDRRPQEDPKSIGILYGQGATISGRNKPVVTFSNGNPLRNFRNSNTFIDRVELDPGMGAVNMDPRQPPERGSISVYWGVVYLNRVTGYTKFGCSRIRE